MIPTEGVSAFRLEAARTVCMHALTPWRTSLATNDCAFPVRNHNAISRIANLDPSQYGRATLKRGARKYNKKSDTIKTQ